MVMPQTGLHAWPGPCSDFCRPRPTRTYISVVTDSYYKSLLLVARHGFLCLDGGAVPDQLPPGLMPWPRSSSVGPTLIITLIAVVMTLLRYPRTSGCSAGCWCLMKGGLLEGSHHAGLARSVRVEGALYNGAGDRRSAWSTSTFPSCCFHWPIGISMIPEDALPEAAADLGASPLG